MSCGLLCLSVDPVSQTKCLRLGAVGVSQNSADSDLTHVGNVLGWVHRAIEPDSSASYQKPQKSSKILSGHKKASLMSHSEHTAVYVQLIGYLIGS